jgi:hypothetical protein
MSVSLPANGTDTVALFQTSGNTASTPSAWEMWSDNSWNSFDDGTTNSWQSNAAIAILPKITCVTGINDVNGLGNNMAMFPNPSNGNFNFVTTLPKAADLTFTVTNSLGQVVYEKTEKNVTSNMIGLDISGKGKGVYTVTITSTAGERLVKKVIVE